MKNPCKVFAVMACLIILSSCASRETGVCEMDLRYQIANATGPGPMMSFEDLKAIAMDAMEQASGLSVNGTLPEEETISPPMEEGEAQPELPLDEIMKDVGGKRGHRRSLETLVAFVELLRKVAEKHDNVVPWQVLYGMAKVESTLGANVWSRRGNCHGDFMISLRAHPEVSKSQARDPEWAADWAVKKLIADGYAVNPHEALKRYKGYKPAKIDKSKPERKSKNGKSAKTAKAKKAKISKSEKSAVKYAAKIEKHAKALGQAELMRSSP